MTPTILVVDDEPDLSEALVEYFTAYGFSVTAVRTASEALTPALPEPPQVVLTDLNLPDSRGSPLLERLVEKFPSSLLYVHSGDSDFHPSASLRQAGLTEDHIFVKPCKLSEMVARIQSDLGARH